MMRKAPKRSTPPATKTPARQTAKVRAAYAICAFANGAGSCTCSFRQLVPCERAEMVASTVIEAAKEDLSKAYILRKRPKTAGGDDD